MIYIGATDFNNIYITRGWLKKSWAENFSLMTSYFIQSFFYQ